MKYSKMIIRIKGKLWEILKYMYKTKKEGRDGKRKEEKAKGGREGRQEKRKMCKKWQWFGHFVLEVWHLQLPGISSSSPRTTDHPRLQVCSQCLAESKRNLISANVAYFILDKMRMEEMKIQRNGQGGGQKGKKKSVICRIYVP